MAQMLWRLQRGRPCVELVLTQSPSGLTTPRTLLADTGAGSVSSPFELILEENDCVVCGGIPYLSVTLRGAFAGSFPVYDLPVRIPALAFDEIIPVVGVPSVPGGVDGIACFRFLNRFTYGNLGKDNQFALER